MQHDNQQKVTLPNVICLVMTKIGQVEKNTQFFFRLNVLTAFVYLVMLMISTESSKFYPRTFPDLILENIQYSVCCNVSVI